MPSPKSARFLTAAECHELGVQPHAVYGGKVYSFKRIIDRQFLETIPHGSKRYASYVAEANKLERKP